MTRKRKVRFHRREIDRIEEFKELIYPETHQYVPHAQAVMRAIELVEQSKDIDP